MTTIESIRFRECLNSEAEFVIEAVVQYGDLRVACSAARGTTVGTHDALRLSGDLLAAAKVDLQANLVGCDIADQVKIDERIRDALDNGSGRRAGAQIGTALSLAALEGGAQCRGVEP